MQRSFKQKKGSEVNLDFKELPWEKNICLIGNTKKIKSYHRNKGKLILIRKESKLLSDIFVKQISCLFHRQANHNLSPDFEEYSSHVSNKMQSNDCISVLKSIRGESCNRLIFTLVNITSNRNKFEFLSMQVKGNINLLVIF